MRAGTTAAWCLVAPAAGRTLLHRRGTHASNTHKHDIPASKACVDMVEVTDMGRDPCVFCLFMSNACQSFPALHKHRPTPYESASTLSDMHCDSTVRYVN